MFSDGRQGSMYRGVGRGATGGGACRVGGEEGARVACRAGAKAYPSVAVIASGPFTRR